MFRTHISWKCMDRGCRNSFVIIPVITEHRPKVTDDVDDEKDGTFLRSHSQIATPCIPLDRMFSRGRRQKIKHSRGASKRSAGSISGEREDQNDNKQH